MNSGQDSKNISAPLMTVRGEGYLLNMSIYLSTTLRGEGGILFVCPCGLLLFLGGGDRKCFVLLIYRLHFSRIVELVCLIYRLSIRLWRLLQNVYICDYFFD